MIFPHRPVLVEEVVRFLVRGATAPRFIDGTVGMGGHAEAILQAVGKTGRLVGVDCDEEALVFARERLEKFGEQVSLLHGRYEELGKILEAMGIGPVAGLLIDLGLSSLQLNRPGRGFAFSKEGPLDMRMDPHEPMTAASLLAERSEGELADIFWKWGEERFARRIARAVVERRSRRAIETTTDFAALVAGAIPRKAWPRRIDPATRAFQGLRIAVNRELDRLADFLAVLPDCLAPGGRAAVISYHSLEDRLVKQAFRREATAGRLGLLTKKPIRPTEQEILENPRSRSAKLRVVEKIGGQEDRAWPVRLAPVGGSGGTSAQPPPAKRI